MLAAQPPPPPLPEPAYATLVASPAPVAPSRTGGAWIAHVTAPAVARARPGAGAVVWIVPAQTHWSRQAQRLLVLASTSAGTARWLRVRLPLRRNGAAGWIGADVATLTHTRYWVQVRTRSRRVTVFHRGRAVRRFGAVVGASATPTPAGRGVGAVYERVRQPDPGGFLGPWALHLTALSDVLRDYGGGPGRIAIHGRAGASLADPLGTARSHGCIRVDNADVRWLARRAHAGTPVEIIR